MSQFSSIISSLKSESFSTKKQLLEYTLHAIPILQKKKLLDQTDRDALLTYAFSDIDNMMFAIGNAASYREKDLIFTCASLLTELIMRLCPAASQISPHNLRKIKLLSETVAKERYIETTMQTLFAQPQIQESEIASLLDMVNQTSDEFQKNTCYAGLLHYKDNLSKITDAGKALITAHLTAELERYLGQPQLDVECINNIEVFADLVQYFPGEPLIRMLRQVMTLGHSNVNYFIVDSLLALGETVPPHVIDALARDLKYAKLTYDMLGEHGKQALFPRECAAPEYLAKSDMVHWLTYPTELNKVPDEIEYVGKITYLFRKDVYYVFKFRSDSATLQDRQKNKWLIGWSSENGGTFSNFDEYALFEKGSVDATLKNIKKKLIG